MDPDQTAPTAAVLPGYTLFEQEASKIKADDFCQVKYVHLRKKTLNFMRANNKCSVW